MDNEQNQSERERGQVMSSCGVCGGGISNTLIPHGAICEDDRQGERVTYSPEIDDLVRMIEEEAGQDV
jgi:hypothetical protein